MNLLEGIDLDGFLSDLDAEEGKKIVRLSEDGQQGWERIANGPAKTGYPLPWDGYGGSLRLRTSEVTVWAGANGSGKSVLLNQVLCNLLGSTPILLASFEMPLPALQELTTRQLTGGRPSEDEYWHALAATDDKFWIYDEDDSVSYERVLGAIAYAASRLHCKHVAIDSLVKCGIGTDDYNRQKEFVDRLCHFAKRWDIGIHLLHHVRKTATETDRPDKWSVKGAGEITDLVDNVLLLWRNKQKELCDGHEHEPDAVLMVRKQRHGEWEGDIALWYDIQSKQFHPKDQYPRSML